MRACVHARARGTADVWFVEECSDLAWEVIVVDDNSPDGTQEVARQLAATYGEDKIVLKPRAGKLGLGYVSPTYPCPVLAHLSIAQNGVHPWPQFLHGRLCDHHGRRLVTPRTSSLLSCHPFSTHLTFLHKPKFIPQFIRSVSIPFAYVPTLFGLIGTTQATTSS